MTAAPIQAVDLDDEPRPLRDAEWMPRNPWACPSGQLALTSTADRDTWLAARREGIGASDVAAVFGVSRWSTPFDVWAEKTGRVHPLPETPAQRRGRILEDGVADLWVATRDPREEGPMKLRRAGLMRHRQHRWMQATVDRLSVCQAGRCVTELKTGVDVSEWDDNEVPVAYQLQVQQQLAVTGRDHAHIVLLHGARFGIHERVIARDDELIARMIDFVGGWWALHVVDDVEPPATAGAEDALSRLYGDPDPAAILDLPERMHTLPMRVSAISKEIADLERDKADLVAQIKQAAGNRSIIKANGITVATWKPTKKIAGVNADWRKANPDLTAEYSREVTAVEVDVDAMVTDHPDLVGDGQPLYRVRQFRWT